MSRFSYTRYDSKSADRQTAFRNLFEQIEDLAEQELPNSRWRSELFTQLEYAYMCTGKAIRDEQIERTGKVDEEIERSDI